MTRKLSSRLIVLAATAALAISAPAASQTLEVGAGAPPLELAAADGTSRSLAAANGPIVLIFYRGLW